MKGKMALVITLVFLLQGVVGIIEFDTIMGRDAVFVNEREYGTESSQRALSENGEGLVARWNFDEGRGVTAADSSGNGNDGTLMNV